MKYDWRCNACSAVNKAGTDICQKCNIHSKATPDEIEEILTPKLHSQKKLQRILTIKLIFLVMTPIVVLNAFYYDDTVKVALFSLVFLVILASSLSLIHEIRKNNHAMINLTVGFTLMITFTVLDKGYRGQFTEFWRFIFAMTMVITYAGTFIYIYKGKLIQGILAAMSQKG